MKAAAGILLLAFASLQAVSVTDCPCGSLCETKNACPDAGRHASPDDCCSRGRPAEDRDDENCFHLEPQTDLDSGAVSGVQAPVLVLGFVPIPVLADAIEVPLADGECSMPVGLSPPMPRRLLFLIHSRLIL